MYYRGWPVSTGETLLAERRYDHMAWKDTVLKVLKVVSYIVTAAISFLGGLQF